LFGKRLWLKEVKVMRQIEQAKIWKRNLNAIAVVWSGDFIPLLSLLVIFATYTIGTGLLLPPVTAFTCLSIIEILRQQFVWLSSISGFVSQAVVSIRRRSTFFQNICPKDGIHKRLSILQICHYVEVAQWPIQTAKY
jgi:hypothetical protein